MDLSDISIGEMNSVDFRDSPNLLFKEYAVTPTPTPSSPSPIYFSPPKQDQRQDRHQRSPSNPAPISVPPAKHNQRYSVGQDTQNPSDSDRSMR